MNEMELYLNSISNANTRKAITLIYNKLLIFSNKNKKRVDAFSKNELLVFLDENYHGKSETTIANAIIGLKKLYKAAGKGSVLQDVSLLTVRDRLEAKTKKVFTPREVQDIVEGLKNYQDKALVCLIYSACMYDDEFKIIRNIKEMDIYRDKIITGGKEYKINDYVYDILCRAKEEIMYETYDNTEDFNLRDRNGYLLRGRDSVKPVRTEVLSAITLKKRFKTFADWANEPDFTPTNIKNSRIIYDLAKLEFETNSGMDINQQALVDHTKEILQQKGCVERINLSKKTAKDKIFEQIINNEDTICRLDN